MIIAFRWLVVVVLASTALPARASHEQIIKTVVDELLKPLANVLLVLATVFFVYGVVEYIAGASNETARTTGKRHIVWGLVGLAIMVSVRVILSILRSFFYP